jgi:DNA replication protein DnaC/primosomal protein DnaI
MALVRDHYGAQGATQSTEISLTPKWDENCPPRFREVISGDVGLPASIDRNAYSRALAWKSTEGKGLAMVGAEGAGKSLSLWSLAREIEREGTAPVVIGAIELGRVLAKAARDMEAIGWLAACRVLMIDDLGKERATPAVGALLWELLDARYQHRRPVILTTRFSGEAMRDRFAEPHLGDDIRRRLNELCVGLKFASP